MGCEDFLQNMKISCILVEITLMISYVSLNGTETSKSQSLLKWSVEGYWDARVEKIPVTRESRKLQEDFKSEFKELTLLNSMWHSVHFHGKLFGSNVTLNFNHGSLEL